MLKTLLSYDPSALCYFLWVVPAQNANLAVQKMHGFPQAQRGEREVRPARVSNGLAETTRFPCTATTVLGQEEELAGEDALPALSWDKSEAVGDPGSGVPRW